MCVQPSESRGELVASPNGIGQEGDYTTDHEFTINKPKYAKLMQVRGEYMVGDDGVGYLV